ncbi:unnamed protein product [Victoria cruziana]
MAAGRCTVLVMIFSMLVVGTNSENRSRKSSHRRLFVFGDSFADTGNVRNPKGAYYSLMKPYGETYPGFPTGRWSDGKLLTDFVAAYMHLPSPVPYNKREQSEWLEKYGMNFAYAGSGVFDTYAGILNMTQQIDAFEELIGGGLYAQHLNSSVALVSYAGNDYGLYIAKHNFSMEGLYAYAKRAVVPKLAANLQRLQGLGVKKVAVTTLAPSGCSPGFTYLTSFTHCDSAANNLSALHNQLLKSSVEGLSPPVVILDNYDAFLTVLRREKFGGRLKPCCMGANITVHCGEVDGSGRPLYTVCTNPKATFWWDGEHPSQSGWKAVVDRHHPSLDLLLA